MGGTLTRTLTSRKWGSGFFAGGESNPMNIIIGEYPRRPVLAPDRAGLLREEDLSNPALSHMEPLSRVADCVGLLCCVCHTTRLLRAKVPSISTT